MAFQHDLLGAALGWKYTNAPGIYTKAGTLVSWPVSLGAQPDDTALAQAVTDYQTYVASTTFKDDALSDFLNTTAGKVSQAIVQTLIAKGVCTLADIRLRYRAL